MGLPVGRNQPRKLLITGGLSWDCDTLHAVALVYRFVRHLQAQDLPARKAAEAALSRAALDRDEHTVIRLPAFTGGVLPQLTPDEPDCAPH